MGERYHSDDVENMGMRGDAKMDVIIGEVWGMLVYW